MLKNVSRFFLRWKKSLRPGASSIIDEQPWITFKAIDFLKIHLKPGHKIFEYGGGGSTLFFVKRVAQIITVEHNKVWFDTLQHIIENKKSDNWKGIFIPAEKGDLVSNPEFANPYHYSSDDEPSIGFNYKKYVTSIEAFSNNYFDCVIIDGRSRPACIIHSIPKIKPSGFLVLDNSDRKYYLEQTKNRIEKEFTQIISEFGPSPYATEFTHTSIWKKNK